MTADVPPQKLRRWKRAKKIEAEEARVRELWFQVLMAVMNCETLAHLPPNSAKKMRDARNHIVNQARAWVGYPPEKTS